MKSTTKNKKFPVHYIKFDPEIHDSCVPPRNPNALQVHKGFSRSSFTVPLTADTATVIICETLIRCAVPDPVADERPGGIYGKSTNSFYFDYQTDQLTHEELLALCEELSEWLPIDFEDWTDKKAFPALFRP